MSVRFRRLAEAPRRTATAFPTTGSAWRVRLWTLIEAQQAVPRVEEMLQEIQTIREELAAMKQELDDLRLRHGEAVGESPEGDAFRQLVHDFEARHGVMGDLMEAFEDQGMVLKGLEPGLVDFPSKRGEETVLLCYRQGEERIRWWHPEHTGFAGRRPIPDVMDVGA